MVRAVARAVVRAVRAVVRTTVRAVVRCARSCVRCVRSCAQQRAAIQPFRATSVIISEVELSGILFELEGSRCGRSQNLEA